MMARKKLGNGVIMCLLPMIEDEVFYPSESLLSFP